MAAGQCNCGEVCFEIDGELTDVFVCHCSICRKSTGSGGIAVALVDRTAFRFTAGKESIKKWTKPNHDWHTFFCSICGSKLPGENSPAQMYVPVSLLSSGHKDLRVAHHLYTNSKGSWETIADTGKQHPEGFGS